MRHRRLVSGGAVYFHGISHAKGLAADGQNLPSDVSHLWDGGNSAGDQWTGGLVAGWRAA